MRKTTFAALILAGALVRLAALPLPGTEDTFTWKIWEYAAAKDVTSMCGVGGNPPERGVLHWDPDWSTVDYPPVALYELALVGKAYRAFDAEFTNDWRLTAAVKVPGFLFGLALTTALHFALRRFTGRTTDAQWAALPTMRGRG